MKVLLEELHADEALFESLREARVARADHARMVAIALLARHGWSERDFADTVIRLGLHGKVDCD